MRRLVAAVAAGELVVVVMGDVEAVDDRHGAPLFALATARLGLSNQVMPFR
jgi:hypothetical protein